MAKLPERNTTIKKIYAAYERKTCTLPRAHLGASVIGRECRRQLWLSFRWAFTDGFKGRILRLFDRGFREEKVFIDDLKMAGCEVYDRNPETGGQFTFRDIGGHFGGSMDACARGLVEAPEKWHVVEMKTHNGKSFADLIKKGVQESKPEHYIQMQIYMMFTGMERAYYLAVNKDTDELYGERVKYRATDAKKALARAKAIITSNEPLERISNDPAFYLCKMCAAADVCQNKMAHPSVNCRTCLHSTPELDGDARWSCAVLAEDLTVKKQRDGCGMHLFIPSLLPYEAMNWSKEGNWVQYKTASGETFYNGSREDLDVSPCYSSKEIAIMQPWALEEPLLHQVKEAFPGEVTGARPF